MVQKYRFDKMNIGLQFRELIHSVKIVNIADSENIYVMTKG